MVKVMSGNIEQATLRRKTFSGHGLELVVSNRLHNIHVTTLRENLASHLETIGKT